MKKFKKVSFIILTILVLTIIVGALVLYYVDPDKLKATIDYIQVIANHPLPIIGVSVGVFAFTIFKIFSNTSFGKKVYNKANEKVDSAIVKIESLESKAQEHFDKAEKIKNDTLGVLNQVFSEIDNLYKDLISVCETSPNAKIKALGEKIKTRTESVKETINEKINDFGKTYDLKEDVNFTYLLNEIEQLKAQLSKVVVENEREETINY